VRLYIGSKLPFYHLPTTAASWDFCT